MRPWILLPCLTLLVACSSKTVEDGGLPETKYGLITAKEEVDLDSEDSNTRTRVFASVSSGGGVSVGIGVEVGVSVPVCVGGTVAVCVTIGVDVGVGETVGETVGVGVGVIRISTTTLILDSAFGSVSVSTSLPTLSTCVTMTTKVLNSTAPLGISSITVTAISGKFSGGRTPGGTSFATA